MELVTVSLMLADNIDNNHLVNGHSHSHTQKSKTYDLFRRSNLAAKAALFLLVFRAIHVFMYLLYYVWSSVQITLEGADRSLSK